jgi:hypothetical protein
MRAASNEATVRSSFARLALVMFAGGALLTATLGAGVVWLRT